MAVRAVDFPQTSWFNCTTPLNLIDLRGKVVLLDFFTYCCVNCINNIEVLKKLQQRYGTSLVIIGIHTPKFENEKKDKALQSAISRLGIDYAVHNDASLTLSQAYAIKAWPSMVLIDLKGYIIDTFQGETSLQVLSNALDVHLAPIPFIEKTVANKNPNALYFPQKILCTSDYLVVANTGANALLICNYEGEILDKVMQIPSPLGLCEYNEKIYVTSGVSNRIYRYDTSDKTLEIWCDDLATPYDIVVVNNTLVVAMAGSHQLVAYNEDATPVWHVGNRFEALRDGVGEAAQLAQPSGMDVDGNCIYFVDAESSSLRQCEAGVVQTLIGEGLFTFGDNNEGNILLQHPQDVAFGKIGDGCGGGRLFIADTFNSKLKVFNPENREMMTLFESLNEPCGLDKKGCDIYIADTNAHAIVRFNLSQMKAYPFDLYE